GERAAQPAGGDVLSDAEIGADPGDGAVARLRQRLENPADLSRLDASRHPRRVPRRGLPPAGAGLGGAQPGRPAPSPRVGCGMGANRLRMLWDVVVPSALPELLNGIRTALALSFILLVSSELIAAREGLGYLIGFLGASGTYDAMFAVVLTVALLGFFADRIYL